MLFVKRLIVLLVLTISLSGQVFDGLSIVESYISDSKVYDVSATGSMKPMFDDRYWILVKMLPFENLSIDDVIIYESKIFKDSTTGLPKLIVHQIWRRSSSGMIVLVRGIANPLPDSELITQDMYRGTVVGWIRKPRT